MYIHREGYLIILLAALGLGVINTIGAIYLSVLQPWLGIASLVFFGLIVQFFRNPKRAIPTVGEGIVYAPADGQVVVIEEVEEPEYFQEKRLQISIFMSPLNVHVIRAAIGGTVQYAQYHPGKYLVAWHPKSSTENERTTVVIKNAKWKFYCGKLRVLWPDGSSIMYRKVKYSSRARNWVHQIRLACRFVFTA